MNQSEVVRILEQAKDMVDIAIPLPLRHPSDQRVISDASKLRAVALEFCLYVIKEDLDELADLLRPHAEE